MITFDGTKTVTPGRESVDQRHVGKLSPFWTVLPFGVGRRSLIAERPSNTVRESLRYSAEITLWSSCIHVTGKSFVRALQRAEEIRDLSHEMYIPCSLRGARSSICTYHFLRSTGAIPNHMGSSCLVKRDL